MLLDIIANKFVEIYAKAYRRYKATKSSKGVKIIHAAETTATNSNGYSDTTTIRLAQRLILSFHFIHRIPFIPFLFEQAGFDSFFQIPARRCRRQIFEDLQVVLPGKFGGALR